LLDVTQIPYILRALSGKRGRLGTRLTSIIITTYTETYSTYNIGNIAITRSLSSRLGNRVAESIIGIHYLVIVLFIILFLLFFGLLVAFIILVVVLLVLVRPPIFIIFIVVILFIFFIHLYLCRRILNRLSISVYRFYIGGRNGSSGGFSF